MLPIFSNSVGLSLIGLQFFCAVASQQHKKIGGGRQGYALHPKIQTAD
jgi:hypothetical protein